MTPEELWLPVVLGALAAAVVVGLLALRRMADKAATEFEEEDQW
jgi:hypothetical protein